MINVLAALGVLLQVFDLYTTNEAIRSGVGRESNPLLRGLASNFWQLLGVKLVTVAAIVWIAISQDSWALYALLALDVYYGVIVVNNWRILHET